MIKFSGTNGSAPNPTNWKYDLGGGGWGNNEWEYYTDSRDNSALDGNGNLVITAITNTNPTYTCPNSTPQPSPMACATRLRPVCFRRASKNLPMAASKPTPDSEGTRHLARVLDARQRHLDINPWPGSGEIDIMENLGKAANRPRSTEPCMVRVIPAAAASADPL